MKPCPHCGKELPQEMQFCPYCMEKLITETVIGDTPIRRCRRWLWILIFLLLLLLVVGSWWLRKQWRLSPIPNQEDTVASASRTTTTITTAVHTTATSTATTKTTSTIATTTTTVEETTSSTTTTTTATATTTATTTSTTMPTTMLSVATGSTMRTTAHTTAAPCATGHSWEDITETVHVEEKGHYETKTVEKRLTLFRCALCYEEFGTLENYYDHFDAQHDGNSLEIVFRDRYETFAEYRQVEEQTWVVDTPAHDKTITMGRRCRDCGKTETNEHKE